MVADKACRHDPAAAIEGSSPFDMCIVFEVSAQFLQTIAVEVGVVGERDVDDGISGRKNPA